MFTKSGSNNLLPYEYHDNLHNICNKKGINIENAKDKLQNIIKCSEFNRLPILRKIDVNKIYKLQQIADSIRSGFDNVVIVGIGASILNAKNIIQFSSTEINDNIKFHYIETVDPEVIDTTLSKIDIKKTAFLIISKSGDTIETHHITLSMVQIFQNLQITNFGKNFFFILGVQQSKLRNIANNLNSTIIEHEDISGRYSFFTAASLFTGLILNINIKQLCQGANLVLDDFSNNLSNSLVAKSAIFITSMHHINKNILVNLCYTHKLSKFMEWYEQLISESLGKNGKGITPQCKIGPSFQHSALQLYIDGPEDKSFTLFNISKSQPNKFINLDQSISTSLNKILRIEMQCVYKSIIDKGLPFREIKVNELSLLSFGSLIMHNILELALAGYLLDINPFNQNAVEKLKQEISNLS